MLDFLMISISTLKNGYKEIRPKFVIKKSSDLMIRGSDFYAVWVESRSLWSTDEQDAIDLIDAALKEEERRIWDENGGRVVTLYLWDSSTNMIDKWHNYCKKQMPDIYHGLDEKLVFSNTYTKKEDYASKRLPYPLERGDTPGYDKLMSTLYSAEERRKIEWAIGSIVNGDSSRIQKFLVLYGAAGTGKSTVLNIIQNLFEGYYSVFDAKALGSASNDFALESFSSNPLVAIQHDGDLSRIEDNTRLNSLVSHELMRVNEKFKTTYSNSFNSFLFMGTNKPVKITDAKSGLIRRLIDVTPTGEKLSSKDYKVAVKNVAFELGAIAMHCQEVYLQNPGYYDGYIPTSMMGASNDFYNFVEDSFTVFKRDDSVTLKTAWEMYKTYCDDARVPYPYAQRAFKEELKNYFKEYNERTVLSDGSRVRNYYKGFIADKFTDNVIDGDSVKQEVHSSWLNFNSTSSSFDTVCSKCVAQYANDSGTPLAMWEQVTTVLSDLDTSKLHYVLLPEDMKNLITIDFDIPDETGKKCYEKNLEEASKWPATYAELSKSEAGIHLEYFYTGDPSKLSRVYADHIEIKVLTGKSSLRRKLSKCNDLPIATISSGLPLKGEKLINFDAVKNENGIRALIKKNLLKEVHHGTKPSIDFIFKILEDAYNAGIHYDVTDMRNQVLVFAANSTHQADYCIKRVNDMQFKSEDPSDTVNNDERPLVFYDCETFPNLFLVNWKYAGDDKAVVRMINPKPVEIEALIKNRLVGFNCRKYDNHMLYATMLGYSNKELFELSKMLTDKKNSRGYFGEAYNISYTDIYDYSSVKQSLKKFEIQLGIHHQELGLPWDQPVPEELWERVAEYCDNDVTATEKVFYATAADFVARQILADVAGGTVNDTTNTLTRKLIFGKDREPQRHFNYRDMGDESKIVKGFVITEALDFISLEMFDEYTAFTSDGKPIFPGYKYDHGVSSYRGEDPKEGGYVYAEPGIYADVALLDIASMHPHSLIAEELFGPVYTKVFKELVGSRLAVKHEDWESAKTLLNGKLAPYIDRILAGDISAKDLAYALKIAINAVYGQTFAKYKNAFKDPRNIDNIVAKRGALFMINLKHEVQKRGFTVAHIKTDSIKIPNATPEIIDFVTRYGNLYGYSFEHEATYDRMCLVNDAVYIAKYKEPHKDKATGEDIWWTATGAQFQVPYVFKTLFSKQSIQFDDLCETKAVQEASIFLDMNEDLPDVSGFEKELSNLKKGDKDPERQEELKKLIAAGHNYNFVGRIGLFCPIKPGKGGGLLVRESVDSHGDTKYGAVTASKGYRWKEAEVVKNLELYDDIDKTYYDELVNGAVDAISEYGDFEWFVSNDAIDLQDKKDDTDPWHDDTNFDKR